MYKRQVDRVPEHDGDAGVWFAHRDDAYDALMSIRVGFYNNVAWVAALEGSDCPVKCLEMLVGSREFGAEAI